MLPVWGIRTDYQQFFLMHYVCAKQWLNAIEWIIYQMYCFFKPEVAALSVAFSLVTLGQYYFKMSMVSFPLKYNQFLGDFLVLCWKLYDINLECR